MDANAIPWDKAGIIAAGSVAGVVVLLHALKPYVLRKPPNGIDTKVSVLQERMDTVEGEVKLGRERFHELTNQLATLQGLLERSTRRKS